MSCVVETLMAHTQVGLFFRSFFFFAKNGAANENGTVLFLSQCLLEWSKNDLAPAVVCC